MSVGWVRRTQVGFTRPAHLMMPISGKPETGAPQPTIGFRDI